MKEAAGVDVVLLSVGDMFLIENLDHRALESHIPIILLAEPTARTMPIDFMVFSGPSHSATPAGLTRQVTPVRSIMSFADLGVSKPDTDFFGTFAMAAWKLYTLWKKSDFTAETSNRFETDWESYRMTSAPGGERRETPCLSAAPCLSSAHRSLPEGNRR